MGGPSSTQKAAQAQTLSNAQQEGKLAGQSAEKYNQAVNTAMPFYANEQQTGLPFFNNLTDYNAGTTAQAFAPAKADYLRRTASMGYLPSGFKTAGLNDINEAQGRAFDANLQNALYANWNAKQQGAQGLMGVAGATNPASFYGGSSSASSAAMNPLQAQQNMWSGVLGGAVKGGLSALPF